MAEVDRKGVRNRHCGQQRLRPYLSRNLKNATLVRANAIQGSYDVFVADKLEVLSGLKPRLVTDAETLPGSRHPSRVASPSSNNRWARPRTALRR